MFIHELKFFLLSGLRRKDNVFWLMFFPIILGCFFKIAFGSVYASITDTAPISAAVVETSENEIFKSVTDALTDEDSPFDFSYTDRDTAMQLLQSGEIKGIIYSGESVSLSVSQSGQEQTVLKEFVDQYVLREKIIRDTLNTSPEKLGDVIKSISEDIDVSEKINVTRGNTDFFTAYFYNLIAMTALFGVMLGLQVCVQNQANLSSLSARKNCSPVKLCKSLGADLCGSMILQTVCMTVCVSFLRFVLDTDLGPNLLLVYLSAILGGSVGLSLGFFIGSLGPGSAKMKESITMAGVMTLCFFSGLMKSDMKSIVNQKAPWFNKINPAAVISDSFYCLNIYTDYERYIKTVVTMLITVLILTSLGIILTWRRKYEYL